MKEILTLLVFLVIGHSAFSQKEAKEILILKNGKKIYGKIVEKTEGVAVKIETSRDHVEAYAWDEVDRIAKQDAREIDWQKEHKRNLKLEDVRAKGFAGEVCIPGYVYLGGHMMSAYVSVGYQFNPYLTIMAGTGVEAFNGTHVPVYADIRANFIQRAYTPFVFIKPGYSFLFNKVEGTYGIDKLEHSGGGVFLNAGLGFRYLFFKHFGLNLKAGYRLQHVEYDTYSERSYGGFQWNTHTVNVYNPHLVHGANVSVALEF